MNLEEQLGIIGDFFAYVVAYRNGFPSEDKITPERAVDELTKEIREVIDRSRNNIVKHWLLLALSELDLVRSNIHDPDKRGRHLRAAHEFFERAVEGKEATTNFIVGPNGGTKKVT